jgi:hypothetical protein
MSNLLHLTVRAYAPPHLAGARVAPSVAEAVLTDVATAIFQALLSADHIGVFDGGGSLEFVVQAAHIKPAKAECQP